jgi:hypothetical protein
VRRGLELLTHASQPGHADQNEHGEQDAGSREQVAM